MKDSISMKIFISVILLITIVVGCKNEEATATYQIPENIIQPETMKKVLLDIQLAEAYIQSVKADTTVHKVPIEEYYQQVFALHETNFEEFKKSFEYYTHVPDSLQKMYEDMLNMLSKMETNLRTDEKYRQGIKK